MPKDEINERTYELFKADVLNRPEIKQLLESTEPNKIAATELILFRWFASAKEVYDNYAAALEKHREYFNKVIVTGYGGLFGFIAIAKSFNLASDFALRLCLILAIFSLLFFIVHELWQNMCSGWEIGGRKANFWFVCFISSSALGVLAALILATDLILKIFTSSDTTICFNL